MSETKKKGLSRRKFIKYTGIGAGLMLGGCLALNPLRRNLFESLETKLSPYSGDTSPLIWLQVSPENQIILHSSKVEMGQGTFTGLAQLAAEELEIDFDQITVVHAATDTGNIDPFATGGSISVAVLYIPLREMAATIREMLKIRAAEMLAVNASELTIQADCHISGGGKTISFGEIVEGVTEWDIPETPALKDAATFKYIGKPMKRVDLEDKVFGVPIFGMDAAYPDMLYGSVVRSRLVDAKMSNFDVSEAEKMPGVVKIVQENGFVGVVAKSHAQAEMARRKIKFDYTPNQKWNLAEINKAITVGNGKKTVFQKNGKAVADIGAAGEIVKMEFRTPIGAHAQIEPNGAVANYKDGKVELKISTQVVDLTRSEVAKALGIKAEDVNIIPTFLGGGFGRRLHTPNAIQAAIMSRAVGKPIKSFFTRKQEFQNDTFRPPTHHIMQAKIAPSGDILGLEHATASGDTLFNSPLAPSVVAAILRADIGSIRGGSINYDGIPDHRATYYHVDLPFATSFWRSLGLLANTFAIESFMDELALKTNQNPIEMRLKYIKDENPYRVRLKKVIEVCAEKSAYSDTVSAGRAMGFAASIDVGSPCAHVVEVSIVNNQIKIHKVTVAFDCGIAVNPDQVKAQVEGCVCMGISAVLFEKMDLKDNKLYPTIYGPYKMAMMKDTPKEIDVHLIQGVDKPLPVGEPPLGPIGAAIGNAVRRLTGKRLTELPLSLG